MHDVFLSYAREDRDQVERYAAHLSERGVNVWFDARINVGTDAYAEIGAHLRDSSFVFLFWSKHSAGSAFVQRETIVAESFGKIIIPVRLDSTGFPVRIRLLIAGAQVIDARKRFPEQELNGLCDRIEPRRSARARVFACLNMKGGVGKTTLAANLALAFHERGLSVLLVDLDPQANLSNLLVDLERYEERIECDQAVISCFEPSIATGSATPKDDLRAIRPIIGAPPEATQLAYNLYNPLLGERIDLVLGQFELFKYSLPTNFPMLGATRQYFAQFVDCARQQYDVILFDVAPSNSFITECAVAFAQDIIAPVTPDKYALRGLSALYRLVRTAFALSSPPRIHVLRNAVGGDVAAEERPIIEEYGADLLDARIPKSDYFAIRNPNPAERVRDPLNTLAFRRGRGHIKTELRKAASELMERSG